MIPIPAKYQGKGKRGDAESWKPSDWKERFWNYCAETQQPKESEAERNAKTWRNIEWEEAKACAMQAISAENAPQSADVIASVEENKREGERQKEHWDVFYKHNKNRFFKDRTYLGREFPLLNPTNANAPGSYQFERVLEVGCGVGNTLSPLLKSFPTKKFFGCDFAPTAVDLLQKNPSWDPSRCHAYVCDLTTGSLASPPHLPYESVDIVIMIFVLSAIDPQKMPHVMTEILKILKPGGLLLFRDYGLYDMTQVRFISKRDRKVGENYYQRADGTRTFFFSIEFLASLTTKMGFETVSLHYDTRELRNRKRNISMYRVWLNGIFKKPGGVQTIQLHAVETDEKDIDDDEEGEADVADRKEKRPEKEKEKEKATPAPAATAASNENAKKMRTDSVVTREDETE